MISLEVFEPTKEKPYKEIYYRDERGFAVQHVVLDLAGRLIEKSVSEFSDTGQLKTHVIFGSDYVSPLGYREYVFDDNDIEIGYKDYHYKQNQTAQQSLQQASQADSHSDFENNAVMDDEDLNNPNTHTQLYPTLILVVQYIKVNETEIKWVYLNAENNPIGYELFTVTSQGIVSQGVFNNQDNPIPKNNIPCYMVF